MRKIRARTGQNRTIKVLLDKKGAVELMYDR